jgi:hypothetical protein
MGHSWLWKKLEQKLLFSHNVQSSAAIDLESSGTKIYSLISSRGFSTTLFEIKVSREH